MPKWTPLPSDKFLFQQDQQEFLKARRSRYCKACKLTYEVGPPNYKCPTCDTKSVRLFDRLTIIAGRRWGKSKIGSMAALEEACIPNSIGWCCAPTNPKLHRYVIPAMQQLIPEEWIKHWDAEHLDLRLENGSLIHFQTLEDPDQGRGQGLDWLWIDEVCELTKAHWDVIRPSLGDKQGCAFFTTSPRSYDWVYDKLYKPAVDEIPGYWALHARSSEGVAFQTAEGKAFLEAEKSTMSDEMYKQEYEADFVTFTGAVYGEYLKDHHYLYTDDQIRKLIPEWPSLDPNRPVLIGIDTGADHPFGGVKIVSTEYGLVVVGEYLERNSAFIEHANALKRLASSNNTKWAINKNDKQASIELAQHGIYCAAAANDQVAGIERVKSWLHARQLWFVAPKTEKTIRQMKSYRWAENYSPKDGAARKEKVHKMDDELPDALRYALMSWPILPKKAIETPQLRDLSSFPAEQRTFIERMRKIEEEPKEPTDVTGDFYA